MRARIQRHLASLLGDQHLTPTVKSTLAAVRASATPRSLDSPAEFSWHDYAVFLLHTASEIEHSLMVQYLYAAYSLGGDRAPSDVQTHIPEWRNTILDIAKEEMGHFITVQNVLRLIGGALNLDREDFPWDIDFYPFPFSLEPCTKVSLAKYVYAESPNQWPSDITQEEQAEIEELANCDAKHRLHRVGLLYELIIGVLGDTNAIPDSLFREATVPFQASWDEWGRGHTPSDPLSRVKDTGPAVIANVVASRADAVTALKAIMQQGEWPDDIAAFSEQSHFRRFLKLYRAYPVADKRGGSPTWPVPTNPVVGTSDSSGVDSGSIADPESVLWAQLFNLRYRMLLSLLSHSFRLSSNSSDSTDAKLKGVVINRVFTEMYNLRSIAGLLVTLPLGSGDQKNRAGPPFQMPYSLKMPTGNADCWRLHLDLIVASTSLLHKLCSLVPPARTNYVDALLDADQQAAATFEKLIGVSLVSVT